MRRYLSLTSIKLTFLALFAFAILTLALVSNPASGANTSSAASSSSTEKPPVLLADEIIRRLRRLGLHFTKNRLTNPYDPFGEIC